MTLDEAKKVAAICSTADNHCSSCVSSLKSWLDQEFPEFKWDFHEHDSDGKYCPHITVNGERVVLKEADDDDDL